MRKELIFLLAYIKDFQCLFFLEVMEVIWLLSQFKVTIFLPASWARFGICFQELNANKFVIFTFKVRELNQHVAVCSSKLIYLLPYGLQMVAPTTWYRIAAGLNAQLRLVCRGRLIATFRPVLRWLETHANPALRSHGVHVDLAWFQATTSGHCQYGLLVNAVEEESEHTSVEGIDGAKQIEEDSR